MKEMASSPTLLQHIQDTKPQLASQFERLQDATITIADQVKTAGLGNILGQAGHQNSFGEDVQKLDEFSHNLLTNTLLEDENVHAVISEEREDPIYSKKSKNGEYIVFMDPLDGSSNIDTNCPIGTIFSIYDKKGGLLQKGKDQLAAGYTMYGSSVMFVYSTGNGVNGFTLDPTENQFFLTHPDIKIPEKGSIYSINEGYGEMFDQNTQDYLSHLKKEKKSKARFVGSLVADAHRTFIKGGIFLYPAHEKEPAGKLRHTLEVNPFAYLTEQAGGKALAAGTQNPLDLQPQHIHDRSPFIMGSKENVAVYERFVAKPTI
jgi:fructose-1,6-bisphosphatase I